MCRNPFGVAFLEVHSASRDQRTASLVERCFILNIDGDGSRQRGAVQILRPMCEDGLEQEATLSGVDGTKA